MSGVWSFAVVNVDAGISALELEAYARAQQHQILAHWAPFWRSWATVSSGGPLADDTIEIRLCKTPTSLADLGSHARKPNGTPAVLVFPELAARFGVPWTVPASHEALETLANPYLNRCVEIDGAVWDLEPCDRVQADTYVCEGVTLSNFNTPAAFEPNAAGGERYDFLGLSKARNEVRPGGYAQRRGPNGWSLVGQVHGYRAELAALGLSRAARAGR